jgi:hypothetical protein
VLAYHNTTDIELPGLEQLAPGIDGVYQQLRLPEPVPLFVAVSPPVPSPEEQAQPEQQQPSSPPVVAPPAAVATLADNGPPAGTPKEAVKQLLASYGHGKQPRWDSLLGEALAELAAERKAKHEAAAHQAAAEAAALENTAAAAVNLPVAQIHGALDRALVVLQHPRVSALPDEQKDKLIYRAADSVIGHVLRDYNDNHRYHPYPPPPPVSAAEGRSTQHNTHGDRTGGGRGRP